MVCRLAVTAVVAVSNLLVATIATGQAAGCVEVHPIVHHAVVVLQCADRSTIGTHGIGKRSAMIA